ncbi:MAG: DUF2807 domain-containing protein [Flavobacteriales bacterium]|nr:DUF2807 domain-containing protein [Flavobacteriales bacterium]
MTSVIMFWSCNKEHAPDCFQKAGETKTIQRKLDEFNSIELRDYLQIELVDSNTYMVEITGPGNLLPEISTEINDGQLKIENHNTCNFVRSFKKKITVRIFAPSFPDIQNFSTGDITTVGKISSSIFKIENRTAAGVINLDLDVDTTVIGTHTGVCDVIVKGESQITQLFNQGVGFIDARDLHTTDAFVNNSSINDVYVNTNGYFFALIEFSGNVYYSGTPNHIDQSVRGEGRVIPIE